MSKLTIVAPSADTPRIVQTVAPGQEPVFTFPFDGASVAREDADLLISFDNGGELVLENFFVAQESGALPALELSDGTQVAASDFLSALNPDLDVSTAAGPGASPAAGSGAGDYDDNGGSLIDGVSRLGSLGASQWSLAREYASLEESAPAFEPGPGGTGGGERETGAGRTAPYDARAVLYVDGNAYDADRAAVYAQVLFPGADGSPLPLSPAPGKEDVQLVASSGWNPAWGEAVYNELDGRIEILLTQEGHDALAAEGGRLFEYFDITVQSGGQTFSYTMQVVVTSDRDFNSAAQNAEDRADGIFPHDEILYGEWHGGYAGSNADGGYNVSSSTGHDSIHIDEAFQNGSTLDSGLGNDSILLSQGVAALGGAKNQVSGGAGLDTITVDGNLGATGAGSANTIDGGADDDVINAGLVLAQGGENRILGGADDDAITIGTKGYKGDSVIADGGGENYIYGGAGLDAITVHGAVRATGKDSRNVIDLGKDEAASGGTGTEVLTINGGLDAGRHPYSFGEALWGATNEVYGGANNDSITVADIMYAYGGGSANIIKGGAGNDTITTGWIISVINSKQVIDGGSNDDVISLESVNSGAGSENHILGGAGNDKITVQKDVTGSGGKNYINAAYGDGDGNDTVTVEGTLHALGGGENHILGGEGLDSITVKGNLTASGKHNFSAEASKNIIDGGAGNDTVTVEGVVWAKDGGQNTITGGEGNNLILLTGTTSIPDENGDNFSVFASAGGKNHILGGGDGNDIITISGKVDAKNGGINYINAVFDEASQAVAANGNGNDSITISGRLWNNYSSGDPADAAKNYVFGGTGNDTLTVKGAVESHGVGGLNVLDLGAGDNRMFLNKGLVADKSGENEIRTGTGNDQITIGANSYYVYPNRALSATNKGKNIIDTGEGDEDLVHLQGQVYAGDGTNTVNSHDIKVDVSPSGTNAAWSSGVIAAGLDSENELKATGSISIEANAGALLTPWLNEGGPGFNWFLESSMGGAADRFAAIGAYVDERFSVDAGSATNVISADKDVTVIAKMASGAGYGIHALTAGLNKISGGGTVKIETAGSLDGTRAHIGMGMAAVTGGKNAVSGATVDIDVHNVQWGVGMYANNQHSKGSKWESSNSIGTSENKVGDVSIDVTNVERGAGMQAVNGTNAIHFTGKVEVTVQATTGEAYGMYAASHGKDTRNTITAQDADHPVTVTITAKGIGGAFAMYAEEKGINSIVTGKGDDAILLTGDIASKSGGANSISAGEGDDIITLDGKVSVETGGSFIINGGDGDNDVLILKAEGVEEFIDRYGLWLKGLEIGKDVVSIESIVLSGITMADINDPANAALKDIYDKFMHEEINIAFDATDVLAGTQTASEQADYYGVFTNEVNMSEDTVFFLNGDDSLSFENGLSNGVLAMGGGDDYIAMKGGTFSGIDLDMGAGDDLVVFNSAAALGVETAVSGGAGMDVLKLEGSVSVSDLVGHFNGFEALDLVDNAATTLNIDSLLDFLEPDSKLDPAKIGEITTTPESGLALDADDLAGMSVVRVNTDAGDTVQVDENLYAKAGTVKYDNVSYEIYKAAADSDSDASVMLLVQQWGG